MKKRAWVDITRRYHFSRSDGYVTEQFFVLDGTFIIDYPSFFCALGEAMNGPGGYYGNCLDSLIDCLCGGVGQKSPFTLNWIASDVARETLDTSAWQREKEARKKELMYEIDSDDLYLNSISYDDSHISLFEAINQVFVSKGVNILLN